MHIALFDDDQDMADLVRLWLAEAGHTVEHFTDGGQVLAAAAGDRFDLYILDWMVPGLNGIGVVMRLREAGIGRPVLFLTQHGSAENAADALSVGADSFLAKPIDRATLLQRVESLLPPRSGRPAPRG